jgi:hypothetical protein
MGQWFARAMGLHVSFQARLQEPARRHPYPDFALSSPSLSRTGCATSEISVATSPAPDELLELGYEEHPWQWADLGRATTRKGGCPPGASGPVTSRTLAKRLSLIQSAFSRQADTGRTRFFPQTSPRLRRSRQDVCLLWWVAAAAPDEMEERGERRMRRYLLAIAAVVLSAAIPPPCYD